MTDDRTRADAAGYPALPPHLRALRTRFADEWRAGRRPTLDGVLANLTDSEQAILFPELLGLELDLRRAGGESCSRDDYLRRFPDQARAIDKVFGALADPQRTVLPGMAETAPSSATDPLVGQLLADRYEVHSLLGSGGMGRVYRARQVAMDRWVALKIMSHDLAGRDDAVRRFEREMKTAARIEHANTVRIYDSGVTEQNELFLTMELLKGRTLKEEVELSGPLPPARILNLAVQISHALAAAHAEDIIHRDLKPANIMLVEQGGVSDLVKVLDFGLARFAKGASTPEDQSLTGQGAVMGTPGYMSPEQIAGEDVGPASDLYAFGVLLFVLATGREPFIGKTSMSVMAKHLHEAPPRPSEIVESPLPGWIDKVILSLLAKSPAERPASAAAVLELLERQLAMPLPATENARLTALRNYRILDTDPEQAFDDLAQLASYVCGTPIAMISLVDDDRQWFKSKVGMSVKETARNVAFCAHTIMEPGMFLVPDASQDKRFARNPLVTSDTHVRFYAGVPLTTPDGHNVGAMCVMDRTPRQLDPDQVAALAALGRLVMTQLEFRRHVMELKGEVEGDKANGAEQG